ncbi:DNA cytosine methyltransferase [Acutalibacter muris]|uniref:DNA cytosine methyltransferase n=1 Tax=Acutalibacter muris TaxID=1796620 RepID=UPI00272E4AEC|nr:DNA cytosine methyltransferase [Acutalibacter muris]
MGDITAIDGHTAPTVDVVIGGSPCQGLSIAGKRQGLTDERSGLFMEQIRIIKEMRQADAERGNKGRFIRPRYMVWENVVGALSSNKSADFQAVLEETAKIADPAAVIPGPPKGKWATSGCVMGDGWSIAYRVLDAQFWGVPQRRRRIALVADFGGQSAPEILFVRKSVCGDIEPGQPEGQAPAPGIGGGADSANRDALTAGVQAHGDGRCRITPEIHATLCVEGGQPGQGYPCVLTDQLPPSIREKVWSLQGNAVDRDAGMNGSGISDGPMYTLNTVDRHAVYCMATQQAHAEVRTDDKAPTLTVAAGMSGNNQPVICLNDQGGSLMDISADKAGTLRAEAHGHQPVVCAGFKPFAGAKAGSIGYQPEQTPTLTAAQECAVYENHGQDSRLTGPLDVAPTVARQFGTGGNNTPLVMATGQSNAAITVDASPTLNCNHEQPIVAAVDCRHGKENSEISGTLQASMSLNTNKVVRHAHIVRRLTELECERLQGFPDGWTDIGSWVDSKGKRHKESTASARYTALGNSIAIPPWAWVLKRLCACYERSATMASLFDGIGGFPLIWERLNGPGTCLWASEIDEFAMAVTKYRFGKEG